MRVPCPLVLALLISLPVAAASAQSSPRNTEARLDLSQVQLILSADGSVAPRAAQTAQSDIDAIVPPVLGPQAPSHITINQNELTCLTLRTYRVAREHPDSDSVRPAGYSTCQPSSRFQVKTAVDSREIRPR